MERYMRMGQTVLPVALAAILLLVMGCSVGPKYVRPPVPSPPAYKELPRPRRRNRRFGARPSREMAQTAGTGGRYSTIRN